MQRNDLMAPDDHEAATNEHLANEIEKEWPFKMRRLPEKLILKFGIVTIVLVFLEILLIVSNNVCYLGYWKAFTIASSRYRDDFRRTHLARTTHLDSELLDPYSPWRGWVIPSFLAGSTYIIVSALTLRHELYHWKPELLEHFFKATGQSKIGQYIPQRWVDFAFHIYQDRHREYIARRIQKRKHMALQDLKEFLKVLRTVAFNILISVIGVLVLWIMLLRTKMEADNIVQLPNSYVPPMQGIVWYLINDLFYFYPHWIAHTGPTANLLQYNLVPRPVAEAIYKWFNQSHKLHHKTKANLGIAAWYCSPWEQIFFNLFPALIGPFITQVFADAAGVERIWGTHLVTLYVWLIAASAMSVLAHTGYRSRWNDPGKHDLHHERAFNPKTAVNFGTMGFFDWLHGTASSLPTADTRAWRAQRDRQAALYEASRRTGIPLTTKQIEIVKQPDHSEDWVEKPIDRLG
jgi:sterol desaturase/sphingolipid hydroxylase (fatty acid hydroxylase superfamily)